MFLRSPVAEISKFHLRELLGLGAPNIFAVLRREVEQSFAMRRELEHMREKAEVDKATIESLFSHQAELEKNVAELHASRTIVTGAGQHGRVPDAEPCRVLRASRCVQTPWRTGSLLSHAGGASHEADLLEANGASLALALEDHDVREDDMNATKDRVPQQTRHTGMSEGTVNEEEIKHGKCMVNQKGIHSQKYPTSCKA